MDKFEPDFEKIRRDALATLPAVDGGTGKLAEAVVKGATLVACNMLIAYHKQLTAYLTADSPKSE